MSDRPDHHTAGFTSTPVTPMPYSSRSVTPYSHVTDSNSSAMVLYGASFLAITSTTLFSAARSVRAATHTSATWGADRGVNMEQRTQSALTVIRNPRVQDCRFVARQKNLR